MSFNRPQPQPSPSLRASNTQALDTDPEVPTFIEPTGWGKSRYWALTLICPWCGDKHLHGGGLVSAGPPSLGHRISHCVYHPAEGYYLVPGPEGMAKPQRLGALAYRKMRAQGEQLTARLQRQQRDAASARLGH